MGPRLAVLGAFRPPAVARYAGAKGFVIAALETLPAEVRGFLAGALIGMPDTTALAGKYPVMFVSRQVAEALMGAPLAGLFAGTEGRTVTAIGGFAKGPATLPARNVVAIVRGTDPGLREPVRRLRRAQRPRRHRTPAVDHDSLRAYNTVVRPEGAEDMDKVATPAQLDTVRLVLDSLRKLGPPAPTPS